METYLHDRTYLDAKWRRPNSYFMKKYRISHSTIRKKEYLSHKKMFPNNIYLADNIVSDFSWIK